MYQAVAAASRGPARSESATIARYRFAICFENSTMRGWITEKRSDCFFAGTVPAYCGAPDVLDGVPAECFIDYRRFRDFADLRRFLHALPAVEAQRFRDAARTFLESARFDRLRHGTFVDRLVKMVHEDTRVP